MEAPLDSGEQIWNRLVKGVKSYKESLNIHGESLSALFLKGFEQEFEKQKSHWLSCVHEVVDSDGKHYYEG